MIIPSYFQDAVNQYVLRLPQGFGRLFLVALAAGILTDTVAYQLSAGLGAGRFFAHALAFASSFAAMLLVMRFLHLKKSIQWTELLNVSFLLVLFLIWLFRIGVFALVESFPSGSIVPYLPAFASSLISTAAGSYFLSSQVLVRPQDQMSRSSCFQLQLVGIIAASLALRFLFAGSFELLKEEAYYWAYAQHLDIGYLDHPPMVAVLIKLGTLLLGNSELAVRIGAIACWVLAVFFAGRYTTEMSNRENGLQAAAIMSVIPAFFMFGFFMTPDAPLIACWAGTLYFLRRALVDLDHKSWIGVGIFLGLGLFSKYTIALLGPAIVVFLIIDKTSRHLLIRPYPYGAALLALLVFSPVILWNMQHEWASFLFQTQNRLEATSEFSAHEMLLFILILLSPVGFGAALFFLFGRKKILSTDEVTKRNYSFAFTLTLVPLLIFFYFSLSKEVKFNWTSPVWLAALPFMAMTLSRTSAILQARARHRFVRSWEITIIVFFLAYGALFQFFAVGIPGIPYRGGGPMWGWRTYAGEIDKLVDSIEQQTGTRPVVVGMDQYMTASGLTFYQAISRDQHNDSRKSRPLDQPVGRNIAGGRSAVMYEYWFSASPYEGKPMVLVSPSRSDLNELWIDENIEYIGAIKMLETNRNGEQASPLFYRLANISDKDYNSQRLPVPPDTGI